MSEPSGSQKGFVARRFARHLPWRLRRSLARFTGADGAGASHRDTFHGFAETLHVLAAADAGPEPRR
ncbi:hypothetical protein [Labrenzia sp. CE80]|uniref:hypothetical protein n=1 Tax=Labrenzia sp. CE80 TaxID=1788986 RepID=UPI00129B250F|nr:hypothetical protein [Labrenzia sp. CE80]